MAKHFDANAHGFALTDHAIMALRWKVRLLQGSKREGGFGGFKELAGEIAKRLEYGFDQEQKLTRRLTDWCSPNPTKDIDKLHELEIDALIWSLKDNGCWTPPFFNSIIGVLYPNPIYHALADFLGMRLTEHEIKTVTHQLCGDYNVYHSSCTKAGYVVVGNLAITYETTARAFCTREKYILHKPIAHKDMELDLHGCIVKAWDGPYLLFSKHDDSGMPAVMVLDKPDKYESDKGAQKLKGKIRTMIGTLIDFHKYENASQELYAANLFLRRADDDHLLEPPRLLHRDEIDDSEVAAALDREPKPRDGVVTFPVEPNKVKRRVR